MARKKLSLRLCTKAEHSHVDKIGPRERLFTSHLCSFIEKKGFWSMETKNFEGMQKTKQKTNLKGKWDKICFFVCFCFRIFLKGLSLSLSFFVAHSPLTSRFFCCLSNLLKDIKISLMTINQILNGVKFFKRSQTKIHWQICHLRWSVLLCSLP